MALAAEDRTEKEVVGEAQREAVQIGRFPGGGGNTLVTAIGPGAPKSDVAPYPLGFPVRAINGSQAARYRGPTPRSAHAPAASRAQRRMRLRRACARWAGLTTEGRCHRGVGHAHRANVSAQVPGASFLGFRRVSGAGFFLIWRRPFGGEPLGLVC